MPLTVVGVKFSPLTASSKLCCAPAMMLEGEIVSIVGPEVIATVAVPASDGVTTLVAVIVIAFGDGAVAGAV